MREPTLLERELYALGELSLPDRVAIERACRDEPELAADLERTRDSLVFDEPLPPLLTPRSARWRWVGLAIAAACLLFMLPTAPSGWRGRGGLDVDVVRVRNGVAADVDAGPLRAGDRVQYQVTAQRDGVLHVVDVQDDGTLSLWVKTPVNAGEIVAGAAVLDDYPGEEQLWFVVHDQTWTVEKLQSLAPTFPSTLDGPSVSVDLTRERL